MYFFLRIKRNLVCISKVEYAKNKDKRADREWKNTGSSKAARNWSKDGRIQPATVKSSSNGAAG